LAWSRVIPFIVLQTSLAALWLMLSSRPLDLTVVSGSSSVIVYPHFGIGWFFSNCANELLNPNIYAFCVYNIMLKQLRNKFCLCVCAGLA